MQVFPQDTADEESGQRSSVQLLEKRPRGVDQGTAQDLWRAETIQYERTAVLDSQRLGQEVGVLVHLNPLAAEGLSDRIVLTSSLCPHDVIEEKTLHVVRCQPIQLHTPPVHDGLTKPADL